MRYFLDIRRVFVRVVLIRRRDNIFSPVVFEFPQTPFGRTYRANIPAYVVEPDLNSLERKTWIWAVSYGVFVLCLRPQGYGSRDNLRNTPLGRSEREPEN